ncbi:methyltransferase domain-containing protein [Plastoroseomonas hellenica]|uniref:methyltransferase domain-containing protein n=1 Tax=Plastoroseomonas hellenica TaxID=2687306 RepID=UPI001BA61508|nr:methyltransferase domain-containing protein [Plastoroseomonas hellenica]
MSPTPTIEARLDQLESRQILLRESLIRAFWEQADRLDALTLPGRRLRCPICDREETRERLEKRIDQCQFGGGRLERYECQGCGGVFGPAKFLDLSPEMVSTDYRLLYDGYAEANSTASEIRAFRSLLPEAPGPYLNWGCGRWSDTIPTLRAEGHDVWGYEPAAPPVDGGFIVGDKGHISAQFAGIFSNNVIEHMLRPVEEFRYFHSILKPGGRMAHASPCYEYAYASTRFHVIFLTGDAPHVLAERTGFRVAGREQEGEFINCVFERV